MAKMAKMWKPNLIAPLHKNLISPCVSFLSDLSLLSSTFTLIRPLLHRSFPSPLLPFHDFSLLFLLSMTYHYFVQEKERKLFASNSSSFKLQALPKKDYVCFYNNSLYIPIIFFWFEKYKETLKT